MAEEKMYTEKDLEPLFYSAKALLQFMFDPEGQSKPECIHWLTLFKEAVDSFPKPSTINVVINDLIERMAIVANDKIEKVIPQDKATMLVVLKSGKRFKVTVSAAH